MIRRERSLDDVVKEALCGRFERTGPSPGERMNALAASIGVNPASLREVSLLQVIDLIRARDGDLN
jgi:hypothetical protein